MKSLKYILFFVILYILFSGSVFYYYGTPTKGVMIEKYENPKKALLIIDLQKAFIGNSAEEKKKYLNENSIILNTNKLIKFSEKEDIKISYIRQIFEGFIGTLWSNVFVGGKLKPGSEGLEVCDEVYNPKFASFLKPKGDAFSNEKLEKYLIHNNINEIILAGIDGEYCVLHTAIGAVNRGYKVTIADDAIGIKHHNKRFEIIEKYKELGIEVISTDDLIEALSR